MSEVLVGRAAGSYLKKRGCFENVNWNGDCWFDKRFLNLVAFPAYTFFFNQTSDVVVDNLVLLSQGLLPPPQLMVGKYMFFDRFVAT